MCSLVKLYSENIRRREGRTATGRTSKLAWFLQVSRSMSSSHGFRGSWNSGSMYDLVSLDAVRKDPGDKERCEVATDQEFSTRCA